MLSDTVLRTSERLEITVSGPNRVVARSPLRERVECGPHGLAIFAAFREPRKVQDALNRLAGGVTSAPVLVEIMAAVVRLYRAGLLVGPDDLAARPRSMVGFAGAPVHIAMLDDRQRTTAFLKAIRATVRPGDVVIDLGTGTGVLAIAAAQAGARRVYAVEAGAMAETAAAMFAASGLGDRIALVRRWSTEAVLGETADVLVTETLGDDPWEEGLLQLVADARRLLRPAARVIPARVRWLAQPVAVSPERRQEVRFSADVTAKWTDWYGIDFGPLSATGIPVWCGSPRRRCPLAEVVRRGGARRGRHVPD